MQRLKSSLFTKVRFTLMAVLIFSSSPLFAAEESMAPVNPAFTDFMLHKPLQAATSQSTSLGYIPSPINRSHLKSTKAPLGIESITAIPAAYDLRTLGKVTPVRNQGSCGSCWAFGAMASLESSLMPNESRDFSENNLKNTHGFDWGPCDGGNTDISTAYLLRWSGPINETDDPYHPNATTPSPTGLVVQKHEQNVIRLPLRASTSDNNAIKSAVMAYGAITAGMYWTDGSYSAANHAYYFNGSSTSANHEVAIAGWDDNFDKSRFSPVPPGNGAFIIKNSWGASWGESGYFYISYYDSVIGNDDLVAFTSPESSSNFGRVYSYDPLGVVSDWGYGSNTAWFANVFSAQGNDQIAAVSFYNATMNSPYEIYFYTDLTNLANPRSGSLVATLTGTLPNAGYLTIPLTSTVPVTSGHVFSAVVKLTTPGYNYPIPVESAYPGYSSKASAAPGQSFKSSNGTTWTDTTTSDSTMNVCLKVYSAKINVSLSANKPNPDHAGTAVTFTAQGSGSSAPYQYRFWLSNGTTNSMVQDYGVGSSWTMPASTATGNYIITADVRTNTSSTTPDASVSLSYQVAMNTANSVKSIGVFANGTWYLDLNGNGAWNGTPADALYSFGGLPGAIPVTGDWNGSGTTKIGVFVNGTWYLDLNGNGQWDGTTTDVSYSFGGIPGAIPVTGDWNGSGTTKIGVFANGTWYLDLNGNGAWNGTPADALYSFGGLPGAIPVTGDWNGSGTTKIGVFVNGTWYLDQNGNGQWDGTPTDASYSFGGIPGAIPVTGDWNGSGTTKIGVFANGTWYLDLNGNGQWDGTPTDVSYSFGGIPGAIPVTGNWR